jgi:hypothetical protein
MCAHLLKHSREYFLKMNNASYNPANTAAWNRLLELASETLSSDKGIAINQLFQEDSQRFEKYSLKAGELKLDFSKNLVNDDIWEQLINLAEQSPLGNTSCGHVCRREN